MSFTSSTLALRAGCFTSECKEDCAGLEVDGSWRYGNGHGIWKWKRFTHSFEIHVSDLAVENFAGVPPPKPLRWHQ